MPIWEAIACVWIAEIGINIAVITVKEDKKNVITTHALKEALHYAENALKEQLSTNGTTVKFMLERACMIQHGLYSVFAL